MAIVGQSLLVPDAGYRRIDGIEPNMTFTGAWSSFSSSDVFGGSCKYTNVAGNSVQFNFTGSLLRGIGICEDTNRSSNINLYIDDIKVLNFSTRFPTNQMTLDFDITGLENKEHYARIELGDGNYYFFDAIDIASTGVIRPYNPWVNKTKTATSQMKIGDRIAVEYTALANTFGTFANLGKATKPEIPVTASATPDGTLYLYHAGYNFQGKMILVADRNIQHSISYDSLNTAGVASGSGLPIKIDDKDFVVRLMTGGISSNDKDNEWDKIIAESTLGGTITARDNAIWNWSGIYSLASTTGSNITHTSYRGNLSVIRNDYAPTGTVDQGGGFRPVILVEPNNAHYLFLKDDYTCHSWDGTSLNSVSPDWRLETAENKKALFLAGTQTVPSVSVLQPLLKFKVLVYSDDTAMSKPTGSISAVPHKFFVKPKNLISLASFEGVDNASLTSTISGTGACHILVTTDLVNYKTWNGTAWDTVDTSDLPSIISSGLSPTALSAVPRSAWDSLTGGKGGIAFGYLPTIESVADSAAVDNLTFIVDMKGSWDKAVHGIDYGYGYPQNNILRVTLKTNGDYKINYSEGCVSQ